MTTVNEEKICIQCNAKQTKDNPIRNPLGPGWEICTNCLNAHAKTIITYKEQRQRLYPQIQMIMEGLYLGNEDAAMDLETISKHQISAICVCGSYLMTPFKGKKMEGKFDEISYVNHEIADFYDQKINHLFDDNSQWIEDKLNQGRNVLVHCAAGVSRSASFVIAYLMSKKNMLYPDAYKYVKQRRKVINPNSGFKTQLEEYGKVIFQRKLGSLNLGPISQHKQKIEVSEQKPETSKSQEEKFH